MMRTMYQQQQPAAGGNSSNAGSPARRQYSTAAAASASPGRARRAQPSATTTTLTANRSSSTSSYNGNSSSQAKQLYSNVASPSLNKTRSGPPSAEPNKSSSVANNVSAGNHNQDATQERVVPVKAATSIECQQNGEAHHQPSAKAVEQNDKQPACDAHREKLIDVVAKETDPSNGWPSRSRRTVSQSSHHSSGGAAAKTASPSRPWQNYDNTVRSAAQTHYANRHNQYRSMQQQAGAGTGGGRRYANNLTSSSGRAAMNGGRGGGARGGHQQSASYRDDSQQQNNWMRQQQQQQQQQWTPNDFRRQQQQQQHSNNHHSTTTPNQSLLANKQPRQPQPQGQPVSYSSSSGGAASSELVIRTQQYVNSNTRLAYNERMSRGRTAQSLLWQQQPHDHQSSGSSPNDASGNRTMNNRPRYTNRQLASAGAGGDYAAPTTNNSTAPNHVPRHSYAAKAPSAHRQQQQQANNGSRQQHHSPANDDSIKPSGQWTLMSSTLSVAATADSGPQPQPQQQAASGIVNNVQHALSQLPQLTTPSPSPTGSTGDEDSSGGGGQSSTGTESPEGMARLIANVMMRNIIGQRQPAVGEHKPSDELKNRSPPPRPPSVLDRLTSSSAACERCGSAGESTAAVQPQVERNSTNSSTGCGGGTGNKLNNSLNESLPSLADVDDQQPCMRRGSYAEAAASHTAAHKQPPAVVHKTSAVVLDDPPPQPSPPTYAASSSTTPDSASHLLHSLIAQGSSYNHHQPSSVSAASTQQPVSETPTSGWSAAIDSAIVTTGEPIRSAAVATTVASVCQMPQPTTTLYNNNNKQYPFSYESRSPRRPVESSFGSRGGRGRGVQYHHLQPTNRAALLSHSNSGIGLNSSTDFPPLSTASSMAPQQQQPQQQQCCWSTVANSNKPQQQQQTASVTGKPAIDTSVPPPRLQHQVSVSADAVVLPSTPASSNVSNVQVDSVSELDDSAAAVSKRFTQRPVNGLLLTHKSWLLATIGIHNYEVKPITRPAVVVLRRPVDPNRPCRALLSRRSGATTVGAATIKHLPGVPSLVSVLHQQPTAAAARSAASHSHAPNIPYTTTHVPAVEQYYAAVSVSDVHQYQHQQQRVTVVAAGNAQAAGGWQAVHNNNTGQRRRGREPQPQQQRGTRLRNRSSSAEEQHRRSGSALSRSRSEAQLKQQQQQLTNERRLRHSPTADSLIKVTGLQPSQWNDAGLAATATGFVNIACRTEPLFRCSLSTDMSDLYEKIVQTQDTYNCKQRLKDILLTLVRSVYPESELYMVGSSVNGFGSDTSDLDLCLILRAPSLQEQRANALPVLNQLRAMLPECHDQLGELSELQLITAKVPILRFTMGAAFKHIQVDLNVNNEVAIRNSNLLKQYSQFDRRVKPLVVVVKEWAKRQCINDPLRSTFSSYSLELMCIHYLQVGCQPPVLPSLQSVYPGVFSEQRDIRQLVYDSLRHPEPMTPDLYAIYNPAVKLSLGELLVGFMRYYARQFRYAQSIVSVRAGSVLPRRAGDCMHIEEPFTCVNTAHSIYDGRVFERLKQCFASAHDTLAASRQLASIMRPPLPTQHSSAQLNQTDQSTGGGGGTTQGSCSRDSITRAAAPEP